MKKIIITLIILAPFITNAQYINRDGTTNWYGQMSVGKQTTVTAPAGAWLEIGKDSTTKGVIIPRIVSTASIASPTRGLIAYTITDKRIKYYDGTAWRTLSLSGTDWDLLGNSGTDTAVNFIGTIDGVPLGFRTSSNKMGWLESGNNTVSFGLNSYQPRGTSQDNIALGRNALQSGTDMYNNIGIGSNSMKNLHDGSYNIAIGVDAGLANISGSNNAFLGNYAGKYMLDSTYYMIWNMIDQSNVAGDIANSPLVIRQDATPALTMINLNGQIKAPSIISAAGMKELRYNTTTKQFSIADTAGVITPSWSLTGNTGTTAGTNFIGTADNIGLMFKTNNVQSGYLDRVNLSTSFGYQSLLVNAGALNTAFGYRNLVANTSGTANTAIGIGNLNLNTTGSNNVAIGGSALAGNISGLDNIAIGRSASPLSLSDHNIAVGQSSLAVTTSGQSNLALGTFSGLSNTTGSNNTYVGDSTGIGVTTGSGNAFFGDRLIGYSTGLNGYLALGANAIERIGVNNAGAVQFTTSGFGTANYILQSNGSSAVPTWVNPSSIVAGTTLQQAIVNGSTLNQFNTIHGGGQILLFDENNIVNITARKAGVQDNTTKFAALSLDSLGTAELSTQGINTYGGGLVSLHATDVQTAHETYIRAYGDSMWLAPSQGVATIDTLALASSSTNKQLMTWDNVTKRWEQIAPSSIVSASAWSLLGNSGTNSSTNFLGTGDNVDLIIKRNNLQAGAFVFNSTLGVTEFQASSITSFYSRSQSLRVDRGSSPTTQYGIFDPSTLTAARSWVLPNASGTIALTSDIPSGATYILNQTTQQSSSNFNISGVGVAPEVDGSTVANGDLLINGTIHATKATSYVDIQQVGGYVGINTGSSANNLAVPLHIGANSYSPSVDPVVLVSRPVSDATGSGNAHCFVDATFLSRSGTIGYNSYDAFPIIGGTGFEHYVAFQSRPRISNTGFTTSNVYGLYAFLENQAGTVTNNYGGYAANPSNSGTVTNNYGFYSEAQTAGGMLNYGFYAAGSMPNYFGGKVGIGATAPDSTLKVVGSIYATGNVRFSGVPITGTISKTLRITSDGTVIATDTAASTSYTFSTGLTNTASTITNNLSTGVSGGQTLIGSTSTNSGLTIKATTGVGTTGANISFTAGNNGASLLGEWLNSGVLNIGRSGGTTAQISMGRNSDGAEFLNINNNGTLSNVNGQIQLNSGGNLNIYCQTNGKVGIGNNSPDSLLTINTSLHVITNSRFEGTITMTDGANKSVGQSTLVGGTVTVSNTRVTANSRIFLTDATTGSLVNIGTPTVGTIVAGVSFVINSSNVLDTSNINWLIIN